MTNAAATLPALKGEMTDKEKRDTRQVLLNDISAKWYDFTSPELSALKSTAELVTQVAARYGIDKAAAQRDVEGVLKGRSI